jgi:predicted RecA/RadA family phage recombinase
MKNYVQPGNTITLTAPYAVSAGAGALVGVVFGVACDAVENAAEGEFATVGVFDLAKDSSVFSQGAAVYWDGSGKKVTSTTSGNKLIGAAVVAALTDDTIARVRLNGTSVT